MATALRPRITTLELDDICRSVLDEHGAQPAPAVTYGFPGFACISVNEEIAHGIPGDRVIAAGDLVNIDVSAVKDGVFADTGASYVMPNADPVLEKLCRDGKRAMWVGIGAVRSGATSLPCRSVTKAGRQPTRPGRRTFQHFTGQLGLTQTALDMGGCSPVRRQDPNNSTYSIKRSEPASRYRRN